MKDFTLFLLTIVLLISSIVFIIPNLSTNISDYKSVTKILESTRIDKEESYKGFKKKTEYTLKLLMTDKTNWYINDQYSEYWDRLQDQNNIGKRIKLYLGNNTRYLHNPVQIEIENEIIYDPSVNLKSAYILLAITLGLTVYSGIRIKKYLYPK